MPVLKPLGIFDQVISDLGIKIQPAAAPTPAAPAPRARVSLVNPRRQAPQAQPQPPVQTQQKPQQLVSDQAGQQSQQLVSDQTSQLDTLKPSIFTTPQGVSLRQIQDARQRATGPKLEPQTKSGFELGLGQLAAQSFLKVEQTKTFLGSEEVKDAGTALKIFGQGITKLPSQFGSSLVRSMQSDNGASVYNRDFGDRLVKFANSDINKFVSEVKKLPHGDNIFGNNFSEIAQLPQSIAASITTLAIGAVTGTAATIAGGFAGLELGPGALVTAGVAGRAGFVIGSGVAADKMARYDFMQQKLEIVNDMKIAKFGVPLTLAEENDIKIEYGAAAREFGLWEAIPEALSNLLGLKIIGTSLGKIIPKTLQGSVGKILGLAGVSKAGLKKIADNIILKSLAKYGLLASEELATEATTFIGQQNVLLGADLPGGKKSSFLSPSDWIDALIAVGPQTLMLTGILGGIAGGGVSLFESVKNFKNAGGTKPPQVVQDAVDNARAEQGQPPVAVEEAINAAKKDLGIATQAELFSTPELQDAALLAQDFSNVEDFKAALAGQTKVPELVSRSPESFFILANKDSNLFTTAQAAAAVVQNLAGDLGVNVQFVKRLTTPQGKIAFGKFAQKANKIVFGRDLRGKGKRVIPATTPYHEVGHLYFRTMMTPKERTAILDEIGQRFGITNRAAAEERLVEDLKAYNDTRTAQNNKYGKFIAGLIRFSQRLVKNVFGKGAKIDKFFENVLQKKRPSERKQFKADERKINFRETQDDLWQKPEELTSKFFKHKEIAGREFISFSSAKNALKGAGLKEAEMQIIEGVLNTQFKGQKKISAAEFKRAIVAELMPLDLIATDTYAEAGAADVGHGDADLQTHIYNGPFEHGHTGHFAGDFEQILQRKDVELVQVPTRTEWAVIKKGVALTEDNLAENTFVVKPTYEEASKWVDARLVGETGSVNVGRKGLFGHTRVWTDGETRYVAEIQSDLFQKVAPIDLKVSGRTISLRRESDIQRIKENEKKIRLANELLKTGDIPSSKKKTVEENNKFFKTEIKQLEDAIGKFDAELAKEKEQPIFKTLNPYRNIWHERMTREEIRLAALDGMNVLRFPTAETIAKIEGYTNQDARYRLIDNTEPRIGGEIDDIALNKNKVIVKINFDGSFTAAEVEETVNFDRLRIENIVDLAESIKDSINADIENDTQGKNFFVEKYLRNFLQSKNQSIEVGKEKDFFDNNDQFAEFAAEKETPSNIKEFVNELNSNGSQGYKSYITFNNSDITVYDGTAAENYPAPANNGKPAGEGFSIQNFDESQQTVLHFYEQKVKKYLEKSRRDNLKNITDDQGNTWLETKITEADGAAVDAFQTPDFMADFIPEEPANNKPIDQTWNEYIDSSKNDAESAKRNSEFEAFYRDNLAAMSDEQKVAVSEDSRDSVEIVKDMQRLIAEANDLPLLTQEDIDALGDAIQVLTDFENEVNKRGDELAPDVASDVELLTHKWSLATLSAETTPQDQGEFVIGLADNIASNIAPAFGRGAAAIEAIASRDIPSLIKMLRDKQNRAGSLSEREQTALTELSGIEGNVREFFNIGSDEANNLAGELFADAVAEATPDARRLRRQQASKIKTAKQLAESKQKRRASETRKATRLKDKIVKSQIKAAAFAEKRQAANNRRGTKKRIRELTNQIDISPPAGMSERGMLRLVMKKERAAAARAFSVGKKEGLLVGKNKATTLREKARKDRQRRELVGELEKIAARVRVAEKKGSGIAVEYTKKLREILDSYDFKTPTKKTIKLLRSVADALVVEGDNLDPAIKKQYIDRIARLEKTPIKKMSDDDLQELNTILQQLAEAGAVKLSLNKFNAEADFDRKLNNLVENTVNAAAKFEDIGKGSGKTKIDKSRGRPINFDMQHTARIANLFDGSRMLHDGPNAMIARGLSTAARHGTLQGQEIVKTRFDEILNIYTETTEEEQQFITLRKLEAEGDNNLNAAQKVRDIYFEGQTPDKVGDLTKEKADEIVGIFIETFKQLQPKTIAVFEQLENKPFPAIPNYGGKTKYKDIGFSQDNFNSVATAGGLAMPTHTQDGFTIEKNPAANGIPRTDIFNLFIESVMEQTYYNNVEPVLRNTNEILGTKAYKQVAGKAAVSWWNEYLPIVANNGRIKETPLGNLAKAGRINLTNAILGYQVSTMSVQLTVVFEGAPALISRYGSIKGTSVFLNTLAELAKSFASNKYYRGTLSQSEVLRLRSGDLGELAFSEAISQAQDDIVANKDRKIFSIETLKLARNTINQKGYAGLRFFDLRAASATWQAVFKAGKKSGLSDAEAKDEAEFVVGLTNGTAEVAERPLVLSQGEGARTFFALKSFQLNNWGIINDIYQTSIKRGGLKGKGRVATSWILMGIGTGLAAANSMIINGLIRGNPPDKEKIWARFWRSFFLFPLYYIPLAGDFIQGSIEWKAGSPSLLVSTVQDFANDVSSVFTSKHTDTKVRAAIRASEKIISLSLGTGGISLAFDIGERVVKEINKEIKSGRGVAVPALNGIDLNLKLKPPSLKLKLKL